MKKFGIVSILIGLCLVPVGWGILLIILGIVMLFLGD